MTRLDSWLNEATRQLSKDSAAQVRTEIQEHYEAALETAMNGGATAAEADRQAVAALGDAKTANCQYRNVLLTSAEARVLRDAKWEARMVCSRPWLKWSLLAIPVGLFVAATTLFVTGAVPLARVLLSGAMAMGLLYAAAFLPVHTPSRGRIFRRVKWVVLIGALVLAFGPDTVKYSWLLASSLWPLAWIEWTRISIRRKLRPADWPKSLYI